MARVRAHLEGGHLAAGLALSEKEADLLQPLNLLTSKPRLYVANVGEVDLPNGGPGASLVVDRARSEGAQAVVLCAQLEADLAEWSPEDAAEYRAELGLDAPGLDRLIHAGYSLLELITFFTATGTNVVRAWTLQRGQTAYEAAGKIHTDMQRGFIRAEVIGYQDLMSAGNFHLARERGLLRLEGREYIVQDGDIIHIRFAPAR
jgi:ribosome-binding ATPase YchF (GTP1/OBG family)